MPDEGIFGKDFEDDEVHEEVPVPDIEDPNKYLPVSVMEKMIMDMNLDINVRQSALEYASRLGTVINSSVEHLLKNAQEIEKYIITGGDNPLT
jgi:hypothetical protein